MKCKDNISYEDQKKAMSALSTIVQQFEGFKSRDYFYSEENQRWIDFIVCTDLSLAKKASEEVMKIPEALEIMSIIDDKSTIFSHYQHVSGVPAK